MTNLRGLGHKTTPVEDFTYSPAMRCANVVGTPELLDAYLANPEGGVFRGTKMPFAGMPDAAERAIQLRFEGGAEGGMPRASPRPHPSH